MPPPVINMTRKALRKPLKHFSPSGLLITRSGQRMKASRQKRPPLFLLPLRFLYSQNKSYLGEVKRKELDGFLGWMGDWMDWNIELEY